MGIFALLRLHRGGQVRQYQYLTDMMTLIPDDVARLAHEQQLGTPQASLFVTKLGRGWRWIRILPLIGLPLVIIFFALIFSLATQFGQYPFVAMISFLVIFYIFVIISLISYKATNKLCTLYPCDEGFILKLSPSRFRAVRWDEIETIWQASIRSFATFYISKQLVFRFRCHDGYELTFSAFNRSKRQGTPNVKNIQEVIEEQFIRPRLPFQFADFQAGETLKFHPLSVNRDGIRYADRMLLWEKVADLSLQKDRLMIFETGETPRVWANLAAFKIANLSLLLALFKRLRSGLSEQEEGLKALATYSTPTTIVGSRRRIDPLPDELMVLAEEHQLGERRVDQMLGRKRNLGWPALTLLSVFYIIVTGVPFWFYFSTFTRSHVISDWAGFLPLIVTTTFAALIFLFYLGIFLKGVRQLPHSVYTFEHGLISRYGQQAPVVYRWDEITSVEHATFFNERQPYLSNIYNGYKLQKHDGSVLRLNTFNMNLLSLSTLIKEQVVPLQLPATIDIFQQGQTLTFGKLRVDQQGITLGKRQLPWSHIRSVRLEMARLVIYDIARSKPWARLPATRVPNLFLFFALADEARGVSGAKEQA